MTIINNLNSLCYKVQELLTDSSNIESLAYIYYMFIIIILIENTKQKFFNEEYINSINYICWDSLGHVCQQKSYDPTVTMTGF